MQLIEGIYLPNADAVQSLLNLLSPSEGVFVPFSQLQSLKRDELGNVRPSDWMRLSEWIEGSNQNWHKNTQSKQPSKCRQSVKVDCSNPMKNRKLEIKRIHAPDDSYAHLFQYVITIMSELDAGGETLFTETEALNLGQLSSRIEGVSSSYWQRRAMSLVKEFNAYPLVNMIIAPENAKHITKWYRTIETGHITCPMCMSKDCSLVVRSKQETGGKYFSRRIISGTASGFSIDKNDTQLRVYGRSEDPTVAAYCSHCKIRLFLAQLPGDVDYLIESVKKRDNIKRVFKCCRLVCSRKLTCYDDNSVLCERCVNYCQYCNSPCCDDHSSGVDIFRTCVPCLLGIE